MWKLLRFSLIHFWQKFRESNVFTKEITKELISRKKFSVRENFLFFHTVCERISWFFYTVYCAVCMHVNFFNQEKIVTTSKKCWFNNKLFYCYCFFSLRKKIQSQPREKSGSNFLPIGKSKFNLRPRNGFCANFLGS